MTKPILVEDVSPETKALFLEAGYKHGDPAAPAFIKLFGRELKNFGDLTLIADRVGVKLKTVATWIHNSSAPAPIQSSTAAMNITVAYFFANGATVKECAKKFGMKTQAVISAIRRIRSRLGEEEIPLRRPLNAASLKECYAKRKLIVNNQSIEISQAKEPSEIHTNTRPTS